MASNITKKIKEIENTQLGAGELFLYGHCDANGEINAGMSCEEAELESIESTLQYITLQTAKVLYDSNPELTKEDITEILFTDLFGSINLFLAGFLYDEKDRRFRDGLNYLLTYYT